MYHNDLAAQAAQIFQFFAGSGEHLNKDHFRTLFLAAGEEIVENDFEDLFGEVDDDRDGRISLEEFTNWYNKDDTYSYNLRTKPLRDIKERLKNPAFYRSLQYFMGKNPGSTASNMNKDSSILDVDVGFKVGNLHQQQPEWGFDLKFETLSSPAAPSVVIDVAYQENIDFHEIAHKVTTLATTASALVGMGTPNAPSQITIEGRPGLSITVPLSPMHPVIMMAPMFLSILKHFHLKLHLSQKLENLDTDTCMVDAGLKFQGQRAALQMIAPMVTSMGFDGNLFQLITVLNTAQFSVCVDTLSNFNEGKLKTQFNGTKLAEGKADMARFIGGALRNIGLAEMLPLAVTNLHKIQIRLGTQQFTFSGINFDIGFLFSSNVGADDPHRLHGGVTPSLHGSGSQARVLYTFIRESGQEMTVNAGEVVTVISKDPTGWWFVQAQNGNQGNVPAGYLEEIQTELHMLNAHIDSYEM